jgi:MoxR-like ATPase
MRNNHDPAQFVATVPINEAVAAYLVHLIRMDAESWSHRRLRREEALAVADALYESLPLKVRAAVDKLGGRTGLVA